MRFLQSLLCALFRQCGPDDDLQELHDRWRRIEQGVRDLRFPLAAGTRLERDRDAR